MQRKCDRCDKTFEAQTVRAKFCCTTCRTEASKARKAGEPVKRVQVRVLEGGSPVEGPNVAATRAELERLGKVDSPAGAMALTAAKRLDIGDTGSAMAALMGRLDSLLEKAAKGSTRASDGIDEVGARRRRRLGA